MQAYTITRDPIKGTHLSFAPTFRSSTGLHWPGLGNRLRESRELAQFIKGGWHWSDGLLTREWPYWPQDHEVSIQSAIATAQASVTELMDLALQVRDLQRAITEAENER